MIFRNLTSSGDWTFGQGAGGYAQNNRAIALNIQTRVLSWVGNCFFDLQAGIDWFHRLDKGQQANLDADLRALILQSYGVVRLTELSAVFDPRSRRLTVSYSVDTIFTQSFEGEIQANLPAGA